MAPENKPEENKNLIFQKQNRKLTHEKYCFFLKGNKIHNANEYTYIRLTFYSNDNFSTPKQSLIEDRFLHVRNILTLANSRYLQSF